MAKIFTTPPDKAYKQLLNVLPANQRWFSFDVSMPQARRLKASRFGMTLWNFHANPDTRIFKEWAVTRDVNTSTYWYRVQTGQGDHVPLNRRSLCEALRIAKLMAPPIPMKGILKDGKSRKCAPSQIFDITDVLMEADGSALWLKLELPDGVLSTPTKDAKLPPMIELTAAARQPSARSKRLSIDQYVAVRDAAVRVALGSIKRSVEIANLDQSHAINPGTSSALITNFLGLRSGSSFKSPMSAEGLQLFIDGIIAQWGDVEVPNIIAAVQSYIQYAESSSTHKAKDILAILEELKAESAIGSALEKLLGDSSTTGTSTLGYASQLPTSILREVWVRGPQHAAFRRELLRRWRGQCSVHQAKCNEQLRASHIVPWSEDEQLRADVNNGLLLSVPLDNLFDRGLISFDDEGKLIHSERLNEDTIRHFGLTPDQKLAWGHLKEQERQAIRKNLKKHRAKILG